MTATDLTPNYVFVYGTLRRGSTSAMARLLAENGFFVGEATYQGTLYLVDEYPGVVPACDPLAVVQGEVYQLRDGDRLLARLDLYEGCGPGADPPEYIRRPQPVRLTSGEVITAWVYLYNHPTQGLPPIPSGDFLNRS